MRFLRKESDLREKHVLVSGREFEIGMALLTVLLLVSFFFLDRAILLWVKDVRQTQSPLHSFLETVNPVIAFLGHGLTLIMGSLVLYAGGGFVSEKTRDLGRTLLISMLGAGIVVQILKHLIGRARPRISDTLVFIGPSFRSGYDSFPSGHTTLSFAFAYVLSRHFPSYRVLFYSFAVAVGFERVGDISHFPSDVLAGAAVGIIVAKVLGPEKAGECRR